MYRIAISMLPRTSDQIQYRVRSLNGVVSRVAKVSSCQQSISADQTQKETEYTLALACKKVVLENLRIEFGDGADSQYRKHYKAISSSIKSAIKRTKKHA